MVPVSWMKREGIAFSTAYLCVSCNRDREEGDPIMLYEGPVDHSRDDDDSPYKIVNLLEDAKYWINKADERNPLGVDHDEREDAKYWINKADERNPLGVDHDERLQFIINAVKALIAVRRAQRVNRPIDFQGEKVNG